MVKGELALVTGGGGGIGRATCETLAREGARVIVTDVNKEACEDTLSCLTGEGHCSLQLDVSQQQEVKRVFQEITRKYNQPPTIVVNCAAVYKCCDSFLDEDSATTQKLFNINYMGTFFVTQEACRALKAASLTGSIVNTASIVADGYTRAGIYGATKAAVVCLTKSVGKEMGFSGIRCNAISPGAVDTPMLQEVPQELRDPYIRDICPAQREAKPQEVADLIVFLASEKSSYINATNIYINGGA